VQHHLKVLSCELHRDNQTTQHTVSDPFSAGSARAMRSISMRLQEGHSLTQVISNQMADASGLCHLQNNAGGNHDSEVMDSTQYSGCLLRQSVAASAHDNGPRITADGFGAPHPAVLCLQDQLHHPGPLRHVQGGSVLLRGPMM
jgi:hypothetical protein